MGIFYSCLSSFLGGIYVANKRTKNVGITTVLAAVCNVVIDLGTVNIIGITAGSLSTLVSYVLLTYYRMHDLKKFQPISYNYLRILLANIFLTAMCVLCFVRNPILDIVNAIAGILFAIYTTKDLIKGIWRTITKKFKRKKA